MSEPTYYELVYEVVRRIPPGRVTTYGAIADFLTLGSARMVGWALNQCISLADDQLPAHRVVNRLGELSGRLHFATPSRMEELLRQEGVPVENHRVTDFKERFWSPEELMEEDY